MALKLAGRRILIAEDEWLLAQVLVDLIKLHGGTVVGPAKSGRAAAQIVEGMTDGVMIDAAVLDIALTDGPCYPVAERLSGLGVPVILVTGYSPTGIPASFSGLPVFTKPFHLEALLESIVERCGDRPSATVGQ